MARILADESCDFRVVRALRVRGHDVIAVSELSPGATDRDVIARARTDGRLLITEDLDFGNLAFAGRPISGPGVLLVRCPESARSSLPLAIADLVDELHDDLQGSFSVWTPGRLRIRRRNTDEG